MEVIAGLRYLCEVVGVACVKESEDAVVWKTRRGLEDLEHGWGKVTTGASQIGAFQVQRQTKVVCLSFVDC